MLESLKIKYNYPAYPINRINNMRFYNISESISVPSVTSILKYTKESYTPYSDLNKKTNSMEIGDLMHKYLDYYVSKNENFYLDSKNFEIAEFLAKIIIDNFLNDIDEIWGTEVPVLYKNKYAGTIDLIGIVNNQLSIIDYKSSYRKKTDEEMHEYFLQLAAYSVAHDWQHKTKITSIIIFLSLRNGDFEKTIMSYEELSTYQDMWFKRLKLFEDKYKTNV